MINGLILAGGKSARMGRDKSVINYHGMPQREYLFNILLKYCENVFISCKSAEGIPSNLNSIEDQFGLESPLNGILSAFKLNKSTAWLTLPVDMPLLHDEIIQFLLANRNTHKLATCFFDSDEKYPEPLFAIWEPASFEFLLEYYNKGNKSPRKFLMTHEVNIINAPRQIHVNINTPKDLDQFLNR